MIQYCCLLSQHVVFHSDQSGVGVFLVTVAAAQNGTFYLIYQVEGLVVQGTPFQVVNPLPLSTTPTCTFIRPVSPPIPSSMSIGETFPSTVVYQVSLLFFFM